MRSTDMAVQNPHLTTDGDINQAKRKRAGEAVGIGDIAQSAYDPNPYIRNALANQDAAAQRNAVNGLPAPTGPNPARAARMQAQFNQPVTAGEPVAAGQPAAQPAPDSAGLNRMVGGALSIAPAAIWEGAKNLGTDVANVGRSIIDAEQVPRPGYPRTSQLSQEIAEGASAFAGANRNLAEAAKGSAREVTGSAPAAKPVGPMLQRDAVDQSAKPATAPAPSQQQAAAPPTKPAQQPGQQAPAKPADSPYFATDSGIAVRRNENGVTEFSNDPQALASAQAMPAGGIGGRQAQQSAPGSMVAPAGSRVLASGSNTPDQEFARLGSAANLGNGIGAASFGNDGDSRLALERFERANQIRAQSIAENRGRELGDNGGRLTIVRDSSRSPTLAELQIARLEANKADAESRRAGAREAAATGADTRATNSLTRAKTQQDIALGKFELQNAQTIQQLRAMMADPSLKEADRQAAIQAYNALTISPKDRYILQDAVLASDPLTGPKYGKVALDVLTGRPVTGGIGAYDNPAMAADLEQARQVIAADPSKRAEVEKRLQQAYGRGLDG